MVKTLDIDLDVLICYETNVCEAESFKHLGFDISSLQLVWLSCSLSIMCRYMNEFQ